MVFGEEFDSPDIDQAYKNIEIYDQQCDVTFPVNLTVLSLSELEELINKVVISKEYYKSLVVCIKHEMAAAPNEIKKKEAEDALIYAVEEYYKIDGCSKKLKFECDRRISKIGKEKKQFQYEHEKKMEEYQTKIDKIEVDRKKRQVEFDKKINELMYRKELGEQ